MLTPKMLLTLLNVTILITVEAKQKQKKENKSSFIVNEPATEVMPS